MSRAHAGEPAPPLLPNLVADPPDNASLETSSTEGGLSATGSEPELLLRFNGYLHNIGPGALDFRGEREAPKLSRETQENVERQEEEVRKGEKRELELSRTTQKELASPPMQVSQRVFTTNQGEPREPETNPKENEQYLDREHSEEPSSAEILYVNADGHHHWHLQRVASYSLWNAEKTAEVAPAQKVGFCLEDSQHVEPSVGPANPVYADTVAPYRDFCQQSHPDATGVYEGISPGWRDRYTSDLGFQWVNASNVLPGEYWLREDVNTTGVIHEAGGPNMPAYATQPTIIPGFDAQAQTAHTRAGEPETMTLTSKAWSDPSTPTYTIVSSPAHGAVTAVAPDRVTYTPAPGYAGPDSFTFSADDPNSRFPLHPSVATVAIDITATATGASNLSPAATVVIDGAPSSMIAGTRVQLSSVLTNCFGVTWTASAGSITSGGRYTAPTESPAAGTAVVRASCGVSAQAERTIRIRGLSRPEAALTGQRLVITSKVTEAGRVRLSAYLGGRLLGTCVAHTRADRTFTCVVNLGRSVSADARIGVVGTLQFGHSTLRAVRPAAPAAIVAAKSRPSGAVTARAQVVAMEGAPSRMLAGTSVEISAIVGGNTSTVTWAAGAGSITSGGVYTAPIVPPPGGTAVVVARSGSGAEDRRTLKILPVPASQAAPAAPLPAQAATPSTPSAAGSTLDTDTSFVAGLVRPQAMLIGHELIMTTRVAAAGRVRLSAYLGRRLLGGCVAETPADRNFTCRLVLGRHVALAARIGVIAALRGGARLVRSTRPAAPVPEMKMAGPIDLVANGSNTLPLRFLCRP
jgi:hypothetical protein